MFAIGNDELAKLPPLGEKIKCKRCGRKHKVLYGKKKVDNKLVESKLLAFYHCKGVSYLAGIEGKEI